MPIQDAFARRLHRVVPELVQRYGTPFHIYDLAGIVAAHRTLARAFEGGPFRQYFAVKALPNPHVLKGLTDAGSGLDCSSPTELQLARSIGVSGDAVVFTSSNTTLAEYEEALQLGALITFDDVTYLRRATRLPAIVAFRVAPHGSAATSTLMGAAADSKFGVPRQKLAAAYAEARARGGQRFGIHGMTCANELDAARAVRAATDLVDTAAMLERELGIELEYVNFGGGLGIPYRPGEQPFNFGEYATAVRDALCRAFPGRAPRVMLECGRYVSGPHGVLIARVVSRATKQREIAGLDASMSALMRPGFYRDAYHHVSLPFADERTTSIVDVVGSLCENIDRFAVARELPDPVEGDIVYIHDTGAHGHAMGFTYNGRLRPAELLLTENDSVLEIRRAETFEEYVATVRSEPHVIATGRSNG
jgi:diaminopimelate decarboxylase/decarboxylase